MPHIITDPVDPTREGAPRLPLYAEIADELNHACQEGYDDTTLVRVTHGLADVLARQDPVFDRAAFFDLAAMGGAPAAVTDADVARDIYLAAPRLTMAQLAARLDAAGLTFKQVCKIAAPPRPGQEPSEICPRCHQIAPCADCEERAYWRQGR